jgi:hypothetical protein
MKKTKKKATKSKFYQPKKEKLVTLVNYILDQSGSMGSVKNQVLSGFEEYLGGLKKEMATESELYFSLTLFDSGGSIFGTSSVRLEKPYLVARIQDVLPLDEYSYKPNGGTPLYDAIGKTIQDVDNLIRERNLKINRVLTVIHTDGQENTSKEFNAKSISKLREEKEATGHWTFVYIGAGPTTWADASSLGFGVSNTMLYDPLKTKDMFKCAAVATSAYRSSASMATNVFFKDGSKFVGKNKKEVEAKKRHSHLSSDGYTKYTTTEWEDGTWSCNCPGWANRKTCKHIGGGVSAIKK